MRYEIKPITLGERLKHIDAGGFILTESLHPPGMSIPWHVHEHANFSFTLTGNFIEVVGKESYECSPATILIKPAGQLHANRYGKTGARCLIVEVKHDRMSDIRHYTCAFDNPIQLRGGIGSLFAARIYREFRNIDAVSPLIIEGLMLEMLAQGARESQKRIHGVPPRWLLEAKEFIHARFTERLSLSVIAASVAVHPTHLARIFKRHFHCSVGDYLRKLRLDYAARELTSSDKPLTEIAHDAGFYDHSHFANAFKLYFGLSPTQYRASAKTRKSITS